MSWPLWYIKSGETPKTPNISANTESDLSLEISVAAYRVIHNTFSPFAFLWNRYACVQYRDTMQNSSTQFLNQFNYLREEIIMMPLMPNANSWEELSAQLFVSV